jgi:hypothetical protein
LKMMQHQAVGQFHDLRGSAHLRLLLARNESPLESIS